MLDTYVLYKNLVAVGNPEAQAKVIQKHVSLYLNIITGCNNKKDKLLMELRQYGPKEH